MCSWGVHLSPPPLRTAVGGFWGRFVTVEFFDRVLQHLAKPSQIYCCNAVTYTVAVLTAMGIHTARCQQLQP